MLYIAINEFNMTEEEFWNTSPISFLELVRRKNEENKMKAKALNRKG